MNKNQPAMNEQPATRSKAIPSEQNPAHYRWVYEDHLGELEAHADEMERNAVLLAGHAMLALGKALSNTDGQMPIEEFTSEHIAAVDSICSTLSSMIRDAVTIKNRAQYIRDSDTADARPNPEHPWLVADRNPQNL